MTVATPAGAVLTVDRVDCAYLVPRGHPDGDAAAWRVDVALRPRYAEACREALEPLLDPADPSVWVIDRLALETSLRADGNPADLARRWAAALARSMSAVLHGEITEGVTRYRDRAAWLSAFVADLADGEGRRPVYGALAGVLSLPLGRAVVTVAEGQRVPVADVLRELEERDRLVRVLERFSPADAAAVWRACLIETHAVAVPPSLERAAAGIVSALRSASPTLTLAELGLRAFGRMAAATSSAPAAVVRAVAAALVIASPPGRSASGPPSAARPGRPPVSAPDAGGAHSPVDDAAFALPDGMLAVSPYAGVLLILPGLLAAGLHEVTARYPDRAAALRHRVLLRCLGPAERLAAGDAALLLAAGLDPTRAVPQVSLPPLAEVTAALREHLVATARIDAEGVRTATGRLTVQDGLWLDAAPTDPEPVVIGGADKDLKYLGVGSGPDDPAWTLMAQVGIRLFARRLTGFGTAALPHLAANVFGRGGTIAASPTGLDVLLEPPPLEVVLRLAGLDDQTLEVPWLDMPVRIRVRS